MNTNCFSRGVLAAVTAWSVMACTPTCPAQGESFQDWLQKDREAMQEYLTSGKPREPRAPAAAPQPGVAAPKPAAEASQYGYYYKGNLVSLNPSARYVAAKGIGDRVRSQQPALAAAGLAIDPLSESSAARSSDLTFLRPAQKGGAAAPARDYRDFLIFVLEAIEKLVQTKSADLVVQPVFELGDALLVPTDDVILGFKNDTTLWQARSALAPHMSDLGIVDVAPHRQNTFLVKIRNPARGRNHVAARFLANVPGVAFAEPNHTVVMQEIPTGNDLVMPGIGQTAIKAFKSGSAPAAGTAPATRAGWDVLASADAESGSFPPAGWQIGWAQGGNFAQATWGLATAKAHRGGKSYYCASSGAAAVAAPGPAPLNMFGILRSPAFDLSVYKEVYVEFWFYAKNQISGNQIADGAALRVISPTQQQPGLGFMATMANADCTVDPTTDKGWRRMLYRVPPAYRTAGALFDFVFVSDGAAPTEGAYIDDIRIVGSRNVDVEPLGNDTYAARLYEFKNTGQIAGLGTDDNDMHIPEAWQLVNVSPDVVVAVIDCGVDLTHPDLNLVAGYNADGTPGGGPAGTGDNHGTSVAGNIGAVRNNSKGVIGTAPGVKIMPIHYGSTIDQAAKAIDVAVAKGAKVLNNSWGWDGAPSSDVEDAFRGALQQGCVVVIAAGNGPDRPPFSYNVAFPGKLTGGMDVICVGASSPTDEHKSASSSDGIHSWGSSYVGDGPDIVAPGPWSYTTDRQGADGYNSGADLEDADYTPSFGGTSSSTPKVARVRGLSHRIDSSTKM